MILISSFLILYGFIVNIRLSLIIVTDEKEELFITKTTRNL